MSDKIAILVVGMHRSGTSALARTISLLGARLPADLVGPNEGNPHGHWEPEHIVNLNDRMLSDAGSDVYSILDFEDSWFKSPRIDAFVAEAVEIIQVSFAGDPFIVIKDPRVALLLPIWHRALSELGYRCVHVLPLRDPDVVADSLRRRHLKSFSYDAWQNPRGQAVWLRYTLAAVINTRDTVRCFISYEYLLEDWRSAAHRMASLLGITWPRSIASAELEVEAFLHGNVFKDPPRDSVVPEAELLQSLPLTKLASLLYTAILKRDDDAQLIDAIAQTYQERTKGSADIIRAYENLYPIIWRYHETHRQIEEKNRSASNRIAGMSAAVQSLWQDLTKASSDAFIVNQNLGSQTARVMSLEAALDHHGRLLAESDALRNRQLQEIDAAHQRHDMAVKQIDSLRADIDTLKALIQSIQQSTSWRITGPLRGIIAWMKRR